jgi:hypothetical protein
MHVRAFALGLVLIVGCSAAADSSEPQPNEGASSGVVGSGAGGGGVGGNADAGDVCDGLDNDSSGTIDDDCPCDGSATQPCYPSSAPPPEGCTWGTQACSGGSWGSCTGATLPPDGKETCCTALGETPTHAAYDAFVAAYPFANMPKTWPDIEAFVPTAGDYTVQWSDANSGNEIIDENNGGIIARNIETGRALARQAAESSMPSGALVVSTKEEPVIVEVLGGEPPCDGMGWGWGSILFQTPDLAVFEVVYLYIGYCAAGPPSGDIEAFFYSHSPVVTCEPPTIPN